MLQARGDQQAQGQGRQYIKRLRRLHQQAIGPFGKQREHQQQAEITQRYRPPLANRRPCQVGGNRQTEEWEGQTAGQIEGVKLRPDMAQVVDQHAQQRQPLEQIQRAITLAAGVVRG